MNKAEEKGWQRLRGRSVRDQSTGCELPVQNLEQCFIANFWLEVIIALTMHAQSQTTFCKAHEQFKLRFKSRFKQLLSKHASAAEAFGPAWERTVIEVPLPDNDQGVVYWDLIGWAKSYDLFTTSRGSLATTDLLMAR